MYAKCVRCFLRHRCRIGIHFEIILVMPIFCFALPSSTVVCFIQTQNELLYTTRICLVCHSVSIVYFAIPLKRYQKDLCCFLCMSCEYVSIDVARCSSIACVGGCVLMRTHKDISRRADGDERVSKKRASWVLLVTQNRVQTTDHYMNI